MSSVQHGSAVSVQTLKMAQQLDSLTAQAQPLRPRTSPASSALHNARNRPNRWRIQAPEDTRSANVAKGPVIVHKDFRSAPSQELLPSLASKLSARGVAHRSREIFLRDLRSCDEAIRRSTAGKQLHPSRESKMYFERAYAWERLGEVAFAIRDYDRALQMRPDCAKAYFNRSNCKAQLGQHDAAILDVQTAIKLDPRNEAFYTNRALLRRKRSDFAGALGDILGLRQVRTEHANATRKARQNAKRRNSQSDRTHASGRVARPGTAPHVARPRCRSGGGGNCNDGVDHTRGGPAVGSALLSMTTARSGKSLQPRTRLSRSTIARTAGQQAALLHGAAAQGATSLRIRVVPQLLRPGTAAAAARRTALQQQLEKSQLASAARARLEADILGKIASGDYDGARAVEEENGLTNIVDQALWEAIALPTEGRTLTEIRNKEQALQLLPSFAELSWVRRNRVSTDIMLSLCRTLRLRKLKRGMVLAGRGERCDEMYLVIRGSAVVVRSALTIDGSGVGGGDNPDSLAEPFADDNASSGDILDLEDETEQLQLVPGDAFGERAVQSGTGVWAGRYTSTCVAKDGLEVLILKRNWYNELLCDHEITQIERRVTLLQSNTAFHGWPRAKLHALALGARIETFDSGVTLVRAGDTVDALCIIVRGVCNVLRALARPRSTSATDTPSEPVGYWAVGRQFSKTQPHEAKNAKAKQQDKTCQKEDQKNLWNDANVTEPASDVHAQRETMVVANLCSGQTFGEAAVVDPHGHMLNTVMTDTRVEVLVVDKERLLSPEVEAQFVSHTVRCLRENLALNNPSEACVIEMRHQERMWARERAQVISKLREEIKEW